jgi:uncharacterized membrane protein (UPF0127 family)
MKCHPIPISQWEHFKQGPYTIIVAKTPCQKQQGLQGANRLPDKTLLLFLGISGGMYFHMRNCRFPLDIISLDKNGIILEVETAGPEESEIGPTPPKTVRVLETHANWVKNNGLKVGDMIPLVLV